MRWKVDALIETRFEAGPTEAEAKKLFQAQVWQLIEQLENALGTPLGTSVTVLGCEPLPEEAPDA